eukprot:gene17483-23036_t
MSSLSLANINLVGFSFGGRVALAFASSYPNKISKLSITGVPLQRSGLGKSIIDSWKDVVKIESQMLKLANNLLIK